MIEINGRSLGLADIAAAAAGGTRVALSPSAVDRMADSRRSARATALVRPVYGRSTGVGANKSVSLQQGAETADVHGMNLLRSHAVDAGKALEPQVVRAMLVIRLSQLAAGGSGINPAVAEALQSMINNDFLPEVREFGGIGTADLPALAGTALTLLGERKPLGARESLRLVDSWATEDALPFISSNALTIAQAVLAHQKLSILLENLTVVSALSFTAMHGNAEAFSPEVARSADSPAVRHMADTLRTLVEGAGPAARIQDPYCLRTLPQILGSVAEELAALGSLLETLVVAGHENPLIFGTASDGSNGVAHHGLFQMTTLARRLDALHVALGAACATHLRRIDLLCDPAFTGLHRFLAHDDSGQSGVMMLEYVAAAAAGVVRANAQPVSLQTVVLSLGAEEDASFASLAASRLEPTVQAIATMTAVELVCAARALRMQGRRKREIGHQLSGALESAYTLPAETRDRDLRPDIDRAELLVQQLRLGQAKTENVAP
ncbi:Histidine ammonia-lyase [Arthrobacter sp. 9AX]|uniref:aromatic amino acid ammonia-lyase n=1 Tax=Arthrobacter sp. 9AX TaxID=2653131 RepID=UPI0012F1DC5B|nr:aromatic amino acid ammonia-lyase [Arthrobacter sp. 9AX]VXC47924.1 Histidine ammonia-lyase [Arthrobacter sp. 9AX]